jgi:hypothetical protein
MNTTPGAGTTLVLLTTDSPDHCGQALDLLLHTLPPDTQLRVATHGPHANALAGAVLQVAQDRGHVEVAAMPGLDRLTAINAAVAALPDDLAHLVLVAQEARVAPGWLAGLVACLRPAAAHGMGDRTLVGLDRVGVVAPCMDQTPADAQRLDLAPEDVAMGLGAYAAARLQHFHGAASVADVVGGALVLLTGKAVHDLLDGGLVAPECGAWAWADLCLRAADAGHRTVVSEGVFVGHAVPVPPGAQVPGQVGDRLALYARHEPRRSHRLVVVVHARFTALHDLRMLQVCLRNLAPLVDGVAVVATTNPLDMQADPSFGADLRQLNARARRLLEGCSGATADKVGEALSAWCAAVVADNPQARVGKLSTRALAYQGPADLRMQRNAGLRLAEELAADAVLVMAHDELVEDRVTAHTLQRMLAHPNPLVRSFDVGFVWHHGTTLLVRDDAPWGHGGTYKGGPHGARLYRLRGKGAGLVLPGAHAPALPDHGPAAHRVAALRLRRLGAVRDQDRQRLAPDDSGEGMQVTDWNPDNRMGLHVLLYRNEDPDDLARWLDQVHALVDHVALVWTDAWAEGDKGWTVTPDDQVRALQADTWPDTGPSRAMAAVAMAHGAEWVHEPLDDNLAQARNAGIHALHDHGGLAWALFIDPDEWMAQPLQDAAALRSMACSTRWGWLMQVANYRADGGTPTLSDSVRMSRLDSGRRMVMDGRVHEGFGKAIKGLQADGIHPRLTYAPFRLLHRGLAQDDASMAAKLAKYDRLLRMQLDDDPHDPGAWVSLGWHYLNDGHQDQGLECYHRALACAGTAYLPFKELAFHHLRQARDLLDQCDDRLTAGHQFHQLLQAMRQWLAQHAPPHPVVGTPEQRDPLPLPAWTPPGDATR